MNREEAIEKAINIVRYFEAHFAKSKEAREDAANIINALEQEPVMPVMFYPQVEGVTSTVVEPCTDAISRANTIDEISSIMLDHPLDGYEDGQLILKTIQNMPPVKPAEKVGHWKRISMDMYVQHAMAYYRCSECGKDIIGEHNYCPSCGAKMQEVTDEID